jgi:hypothetical protein
MTSEKSIPTAHRPAYEAVVALTDAVCHAQLNEEWAGLCRELAAALARKRPSPLLRGQPKIWAAGVLHALGMVNFLFDRSQTPHLTLTELCAAFDVKSTTVGGKSKLIRDLFKMYPFDPNWTAPSKLGQNPLVWMISVNGFIVDARYAPLEFQIEAFRLGLIPYVPAHGGQDDSDQSHTAEQLPD